MVYDGSAEADIRGINILKLAKGFAEEANIFKNHVQLTTTKARELRWYRKGIDAATPDRAAVPLDTPTTQGVTASLMANTAFKARPFVIEQKWERQESFVKKFFVESPWISVEDIKDNDVNVLAGNVRDIVQAVARKVDLHIYDCLTEGTAGTPNPTNVHSTSAVAKWNLTTTADCIQDLLNAKMEIRVAGYNPEGATCLMNPIEHKHLLIYLINVKGSSIPEFATEKVRSGVVMNLLGLKIVVSENATTDWVVTFVPQRAATYASFMPLTSAIKTDEGVAKKIRVWEEGVCMLTDPLAVHVLDTVTV